MGSGYPPSAIVVPFGPTAPQRLPSRCKDLGCKGVADERFGGLAKCSQSTIALQMSW
jgi:hypothetical protein